jgi:hypothetical protein
MWKKTALMGSAASFLLALVAVPPAHADTSNTLWCSVSGASGTVEYWGRDSYPDKRIDLVLRVSDTAADGHHPQVRLVTEEYNGTIKRWPWHSNTDGYGTTQSWNTYAYDGYGIAKVGVQVANFEHSTLLGSCTSWAGWGE